MPIAKRSVAKVGKAGPLMPAEWEPHDATWLAFPHNAADWPGKLPAVTWAYGEIIRHVARGEAVHLIVNDAKHQAKAQRILKKAGVPADRVRYFRIPSDRGWCRDFGPICVWDTPRKGARPTVAVSGFRFNAWAKYDNWRKDTRIAARAAKTLKMPFRKIQRSGKDVVLEGGAIDVNGAGSILTTEECLLDEKVQVRNPGMTRGEYETLFAKELGAPHTIWLGHGIAGDDTHGHVDDLCRFVNPTTVVLAQEPNGKDDNHRPLAENRERLQSARLQNGKKIEVVALPMPAPLYFDGLRLPASYANFYICNAAVLVPTFNDANDRIALGILSEVFKDRPVIGIHAVDLVWGFGTLHCLSQQQPARPVGR